MGDGVGAWIKCMRGGVGRGQHRRVVLPTLVCMRVCVCWPGCVVGWATVVPAYVFFSSFFISKSRSLQVFGMS